VPDCSVLPDDICVDFYMNLVTLIPQVKELPIEQRLHRSERQSSTHGWNQGCRNKFATTNVSQVSFKISREYSV
jgi:hypothetical protein